VTIAVLFTLGGHVSTTSCRRCAGPIVQLHHRLAELTRLVLIIWAFVYCAYPLAVSGGRSAWRWSGCGRCDATATELGGWHAVIRVLVFPLSFALFGFGFLLILLKRDRRPSTT
jgi:hypothetical protein